MDCKACGKEYNHLTEAGANAAYCSVTCTQSTIAPNGIPAAKCGHSFVYWRCVKCREDGVPQNAQKFVERIPTEKERLARIEEVLKAHRCGDSSCIFGRNGGQMTNGGCSSLKQERHEYQQQMQRLVREIRKAVENETLLFPEKDEKEYLPEQDRFAKLDIL